MERLNAKAALPPHMVVPNYGPAQHGAGIVHIGPGAFFRSHLAFHTDAALTKSGGDWRMTGLALRSEHSARELNPQDGRHSLLERDGDGISLRAIGSILRIITASRSIETALATLASSRTRLVRLTIMEKGYALDRTTDGLNCA